MVIKKDPLLGDEPVQENQSPTPTTSKQPASSELQNQDVIAQTKAKLDAQEHINFIIPVGEGELPGAYDTVQINGYKLTIQKGAMVSLPKDVANLLAEKYRINMTAGSDKRIDRSENVQAALS